MDGGLEDDVTGDK